MIIALAFSKIANLTLFMFIMSQNIIQFSKMLYEGLVSDYCEAKVGKHLVLVHNSGKLYQLFSIWTFDVAIGEKCNIHAYSE